MSSTSSRRPYFKKNVDELSALVQENRENTKVLKQMLHELSFRSRPKAKALAKTVTALLGEGAAQEQLPLPLKLPAEKSHNGCAPQQLPLPTDVEPEEAPTPEAPEEPTHEAPLAAGLDLPQQPESLWDRLVKWFRSR